MQRLIQVTADGSTTIHIPEWNENYHSKHGAIQEARHVFIKNGLQVFGEGPISILEIGFGTGLNAFITWLETKNRKCDTDYVGVEAFPIKAEEFQAMNYAQQLQAVCDSDVFLQMHNLEWEKTHRLSDNFKLTKRKQLIEEIRDHEAFNLIYFDAFGYRVQPELWTEDVFSRMFRALKPGGILVTYAARGVIKRNMLAAGFSVEKLEGPPGKREMFRASKSAETV